MHEYFVFISHWLDPFFLIYFGIINLFYTVLLALGSFKIYRRRKELAVEDFTHLLQSSSMPEITFIVPAYNEAENIQSVAENLVNLTYRYKRIIIINDGSTDLTLQILQNRFNLIPIPRFYHGTLPSMPIREVYRSTSCPELIVIDKENGTKHDALNAGLNACETHYFISVDADTYVDNLAFESIIRPILTSPETIGIGATVRIRNGCTLNYNRVNTETIPLTFVTGMQTLEYLRGFIMRQGWDYLGGNFILSGAFAVYSTKLIKEIGGYGPTVADDMEIVLRLNRSMIVSKIPYKISYLPDPVAWTQGPATLKTLGRQRFLWQRGTCESIWFNKCMFFNPRFRRYGLIIFPFLVLGEAIEPLVEIAGYLYIIVGLWLGIVDMTYIALLLFTIWGFTILYTFACLLIEDLSFKKYTTRRSLFLLSYYTLIECLGYRQLTILWRTRGFIAFLRRFKLNGKYARDIAKLVEAFRKRRRRRAF